MQNLESTQTTGWQTFDLGLSADQLVDSISIVIIGTGSGAPGFYLTDARIMGTPVDNPTNIFYVRLLREIQNSAACRVPVTKRP